MIGILLNIIFLPSIVIAGLYAFILVERGEIDEDDQEEAISALYDSNEYMITSNGLGWLLVISAIFKFVL